MFPKNTWYVACTPDEIDEKPLGRQVCGERMVFYRGAQGVVAALEDFCPHRGAPLSLGRVTEGKLVGLPWGNKGSGLAFCPASLPSISKKKFPHTPKQPSKAAGLG